MIPRRTLLAALATAATAAAIDTKEAAPPFRARTLDGEHFDNDSLKGKVVLLQFWATWCGYCQREQPIVDALAKEFSGDLIVLAVNVGESKKKVTQYLAEKPRSCKIVLTENTNLAALYQARSFPLYIVINRDGKIAGTQNGAGGEPALRALLERAGLESR